MMMTTTMMIVSATTRLVMKKMARARPRQRCVWRRLL
jgi:hypothetical protein